jgi:hypothetical protein
MLVTATRNRWLPGALRHDPVTPAELAATRLVSREEGSGTRDVLAAAVSAALGRRPASGGECFPTGRVIPMGVY